MDGYFIYVCSVAEARFNNKTEWLSVMVQGMLLHGKYMGCFVEIAAGLFKFLGEHNILYCTFTCVAKTTSRIDSSH